VADPVSQTTTERDLLDMAAQHFIFLKRIAQSAGPVRCQGKIVGKWQTVAHECQAAHDKIMEFLNA